MESYLKELKNGDTLNIFEEEKLIFSSQSNWLNPLFEADEFIKQNSSKFNNLSAHDTAGGKAAAALMIHLGIKKVHFNLISEPAITLLEKHKVKVIFDKKVSKLACMTETILEDEENIEKIYSILRIKAKRVLGLDIKIEQLDIGYSKKIIYKNLNLEIKAGEAVIIKGENGIGKTTLIKTLLKQIPYLNGSIKINGKDLNDLDKASIGYIKQEKENQNFPTSVYEVVSMGIREKIKKEEREYLIDTSLRKCKIGHLKNRNYTTLSGGEKQRVSLARCLAQKAKILILDEPTSFLDHESEIALVNLLKDLSRNEMPTIICITHDNLFIDNLNWRVVKMENKND